MPPVDVTTLANGKEAKKELLKEYKSNNIYERLQNALTILNLKGSSVSGAREELTKEITKCLNLMKPYYEAKDVADGRHRITINEAQSPQTNAPLLNLQHILTETLPEAIKNYRTAVDANEPKNKNGAYLNNKPTKRIWRHVALDELEEISQLGLNFTENYNNALSCVVQNKIYSFTIDDLLLGSEETHKKLAGGGTSAVPTRADLKLTGLVNLMKEFSLRGNVAATKAYEKLKNIDLKAYFESADGKGYPVLTAESVNNLRVLSERIRITVKEFLDQTHAEGDLNDLLVPETMNGQGKYPAYADNYRRNLVNIFTELDNVAVDIDRKLQTASPHPEVHTLPGVLREQQDDYFLDSNSLDKQISILADAVNTKRTEEEEKTMDPTQAGIGANRLQRAAGNVTYLISGFYEVGTDGYYRPMQVPQLAVVRMKYEDMKTTIETYEKQILDNTSASAVNDAKKAIDNMKKIINNNIKMIKAAEDDSKKYADVAPENMHRTLAELIDPNPAIRDKMKEIREERIRKDYAANAVQINEETMDTITVFKKRDLQLKEDRFFANNENRAKYQGMLDKYSAMLNLMDGTWKKPGYCTKDKNGASLYFITDEDKRKLIKAMEEAKKAIDEALADKKAKFGDELKNNLSAASAHIGAKLDILNKTFIGSYFPVNELFDAGKFGNPPLEEAINSAKGFDRFDWQVDYSDPNKKRKDDYTEPDYSTYKNPIEKIMKDLKHHKELGQYEGNKYTLKERQWIDEITKFMTTTFDKNFMDYYYTKQVKHDKILDKDIECYPLLTKQDQDKLHEKFNQMKQMLDEIGASEEFKNCDNAYLKCMFRGLSTYANTTTRRLDEFETHLNLSLFTIQDCMSGRADTSDYNFRNEPERFARMHSLPGLADKLTKAKVLIPDEEKWIQKENGEKERAKDFKKASFLEKIFAAKGWNPGWEYKLDYNDLLFHLQMVKQFEENYFRTMQDGSYQNLPRTHIEVTDQHGSDYNKIVNFEQLKYSYQQIQQISAEMEKRCNEYNAKHSKPEEKIPQEYVDALHDVWVKVNVPFTLTHLDEAKYTRPDFVDIMEVMHSDPALRENLWKLRQNRIFHASYQEEGVNGTYRDLEHFQFIYGQEQTYNGKFYDLSIPPTKAELKGKLDELFTTVTAAPENGPAVSEDAKKFAKKLIKAAEEDPELISQYIPTIGDMKREPGKVNNGEILAELMAAKPELGDYQWWTNEKDREMMKDLLAGMSKLGISKADHKARTEAGVEFGIDLKMMPVYLSNMSEALNIDAPDAAFRDRKVAKAGYKNLRVPGEEDQPDKYEGIMVEKAKDSYIFVDNTDANTRKNGRIVTGKDIMLMDDPKNISISMFNNPKTLEDLADLQALCYLCNAPVPKVEDLEFAICEFKDGHREARVVNFQPGPLFQEGDFEGKLELEDLSVLSTKVGQTIKNLYDDDKSRQALKIKGFVNQITSGVLNQSEETKKKIEKIVSDNVTDMVQFLNNKKKCSSGAVVHAEADGLIFAGKTTFRNGIKPNKILITNDFGALTIDKMALKPDILSPSEEGRQNIFTQVSTIPERVYNRMQQKYGTDDNKKSLHLVDGIKRELNRLNIEASLADFTNMEDEYIFHSNSTQMKDLQNVCKAIYQFSQTGTLKYKSINGGTVEFNIGDGSTQLSPDNIRAIKDFTREAKELTQKYIADRRGWLLPPLHKFGRMRLKAARDLDAKLSTIDACIDNLSRDESVIKNYDQNLVNEVYVSPEERKRLAQEAKKAAQNPQPAPQVNQAQPEQPVQNVQPAPQVNQVQPQPEPQPQPQPKAEDKKEENKKDEKRKRVDLLGEDKKEKDDKKKEKDDKKKVKNPEAPKKEDPKKEDEKEPLQKNGPRKD